MNQIIFDYHYEEEAERYTFIRLPKALYTEDMFRKLSDGSKVLYGMLLELMGLSRKNGWIDEKGRVYISVSIQKIRQMMNCGNEKAVAMLRELDSKDGVGLIERIKQGQGKPTIIYVKSFIIMKQHEEESREIKPAEEEKHEFGETENKNSEKPKTRIRESRMQEFGKAENKNSGKPNPGIRKTRKQEFGETESNKNNTNNTEITETETNKTDTHYSGSNQSIYQGERESCTQAGDLSGNEEIDRMDGIRAYREIFMENIGHEELVRDPAYRLHSDIIDEIVTLASETIAIPRNTVRIGKAEIPWQLVKGKFLRLDGSMIKYVLDSMNRTSTKIINIRGYIMTALYNAPDTVNSYYEAEVRHDMNNTDEVGAI